MLCVADYLDALAWVRSIGGVSATIKKSEANLGVLQRFVEARTWINFLARQTEQTSNTSVCLSLDLQPQQVKQMITLLDDEAVAYDIGAYRDAPPGLRIWCGATVEQADLEALLPWIDWAYQQVSQ